MTVIVQDGAGTNNKLTINSDGTIGLSLVTSTGTRLPILGVDDGSGHAKLSIAIA